MKPSMILIAASAMGLLLVSSSFVLGAHASTNWIGNDNGEFDSCNAWGTCRIYNGGVYIEMQLGASMTYSNGGTMSLQYNPDKDISYSYQVKDQFNHPLWFQTAVLAQSSDNCVIFTYQVYNMDSATQEDHWFSNSENCYTVSGLFTYGSGTGAVWTAQEYTDSSGYVNDACFTASGGGSGGGSTGTICIDPETNLAPNNGYWLWLRSNACLCGLQGNTPVTFTAGSGSMYAVPASNYIYAKAPPSHISTGEDGNMDYGCFSGNGTTTLTQSFGLSGHC